MKNKLTRKLMLSAFTLLFAVISLGASTYAWFTMSKNAQINAFVGDVQAGEGIEIAVTSKNTEEKLNDAQWYTGNVPTSVVTAAFVENGFTAFAALTTIDNGVNLVKYDGQEAPKESYIQFYIHIKTAKPGTINLSQIKLDSDKVNTWKSDAVYNLPLADGSAGAKVEVGQQVSYKVEDAARIYIKDVIYEKDTNLSDGNNNLAGVSSSYGAYAYYDSKNQDAKLEKVSENVVNQETQEVIKRKNFNLYTTSKLTNTNFPGEDETLTDNVTNAELGTTQKAGDILTFEVKIWIEGWDTECLNAIFAQTLKVQLGVALAAK